VVAGDHGEAFGEHKEFGHGIFCYEESLRVPLLLHCPARFAKRRTIDRRVNLADVLPTLLHYLEIDCPEAVQGKSFHNLIAGEKEERPRDVYFESRFGMESNNWAPISGWIRGSHKYIASLEPELYDLEKDPGESDNLLRRQGVLARELDRGLRRRILELSAGGRTERRALSADDLASLKTLGYISAASARSREMIDAKQGIELYARIEQLKEQAKAGNTAPVEEELGRLRDAHPGVQLPGFYELEFSLRKRAGRMDEALATLEKAIAAFPDQELFKMMLAAELHARGELERARGLCREILGRNPRFAAALILLGDMSRAQEQRVQAAACYRQALEIEPQNTRLRKLLSDLESGAPVSRDERLAGLERRARALVAENRLNEARDVLEEILKLAPERAGAHVDLGTIASRSGDFAGALGHFQEVVRLDPNHALAHCNMGIALFNLYRRDMDPVRLQRALESFDRAVGLDPRLGIAFDGRGAVLMALGENDRAAGDFARVIELDPGALNAHFNLAYALINAGHRDEAWAVLIRFKEEHYSKLSAGDRNELDRLLAEIQ
ncbi:MAG: tetratricopeptide repeat protein, partial [Candidatus Aminicenantes bacterium]|nr:tetratricopeptide repeat protein [Candidatus Aminicenantes bacterium]